jgi:cobalt-zinc-cadmium efflux system outer membrane protein
MIARLGRLSRIALPAAMVVATATAPVVAAAQVAPPYVELLSDNRDAPQIVEGEADVERGKGLADQARARPNPTIGLMTENVLGSAPYSGFDRSETTLQYSQPIELGGKRGARIAAGEAGVAAAEARALTVRIDFAYELARAYAAAEIADGRVALAEDELEEANTVLDTAQIMVAAGREARLRAIQAQSAAKVAHAELEQAKANRILAYARLSALAGAQTPYTSVGASLLANVNAAGLEQFEATRTPLYLAAETNLTAARRRLDSERKRTIPDVTGTLGVRRLEAERATAVVAGVTIPLRLFDRNRGNIAAVGGEVRGAEARLAVLRNDLDAALHAASAQIAAADARFDAARSAVKAAEETYSLARTAYEAGKSPLVELLEARHGMGLARAASLDAQAARFDLIAQLARLQGRTVTGETIS